ncbi:LysR family substrate-binding domain-containing protein, partial [Streptomyces violaceoruber]
LEAAGRRARRAAEGPKLVLAVKADGDAGLLEPILARYASEPDAVPVAVRLCGWQEQPRLLRAGEADVTLVHAPFDGTGLDTETLAAEPRVAVLAADHPLAARDRLELADLGLDAGSVERHIDEARRGHDDLAQVLTAVSLGKVVTLLPASVTARYPRPGVVYRPVPEAPPVVLALAWPERSRSTATAALVRVAAEVAEAARNGA